MANENFPNGEKKNVPLITKSIRGAFNWRSSTASPKSACINQNVYLNLIVKYYWIDDTKCYLEAGWEPWYLNESEGQVISQRFTGQDNNFSQNKSILTIGNNLISLSDKIKPLTSVSDCNMLNGNDTPIFQGVINVTTSFDIAYYYEYTNGEITYYIDLNTKHKLKISKPGRYDDNIVFNKEGLNELIDNIKKYPITDIETVEASQWVNVSDGQPSIKVIHGNKEYSYAKTSDANIISGKKYFSYSDQNGYELVTSPDVNDLSSYYEPVNYKYVKVGSNISFQDIEGNIIDPLDSANIPQQSDGTFRVNVNTDTYEVPVKGIEETISQLQSTIQTRLNDAVNLLSPPVILKNQPVILSSNDVTYTFQQDTNNPLFIDDSNIEPIILVAPVVGDKPNDSLYETPEDKANQPSSWDIWANYVISCQHDGTVEEPFNKIKFILSEPITKPEGSDTDIIMNINITIFKNGQIYPIPTTELENNG